MSKRIRTLLVEMSDRETIYVADKPRTLKLIKIQKELLLTLN
jgi:hypothetical protein